MRSRWAFAVATAVVFLVLIALWLAPLLPSIGTSYLAPLRDPTPLGRADAMLTSWMAWSSHALRVIPSGPISDDFFDLLRRSLTPLASELLESAAAESRR